MEETESIVVIEVATNQDQQRFVDVQYRVNASQRAWVPPLRREVHALISQDKNPWFKHAMAAFFIAIRDGRDVGRISAQIDDLWLDLPAERGGGPGCGNWGMLEAEDEAVAAVLLDRARAWLFARGMTRMVGPLSLSIWDEPGLLVHGFDQAPTVMMGHHKPEYAGWIEAAGQTPVRDLNTFELDITVAFPPLVQRIVAAGERNPRIHIRRVNRSRFGNEAEVILSILNDAWAGNWGIVPFTDVEIEHAGKKLKSLIYEDLVRIAEYDGEPVAFMMALPDVNEVIKELNGSLYPMGFAKLLWWLRGRPKATRMRVPLMGVKMQHQGSRLASQLAFMLIEHIRRDAVSLFGTSRAEIGWVAEDNLGMASIADIIGSTLNRTYRLYAQDLSGGPGTT